MYDVDRGLKYTQKKILQDVSLEKQVPRKFPEPPIGSVRFLKRNFIVILN